MVDRTAELHISSTYLQTRSGGPKEVQQIHRSDARTIHGDCPVRVLRKTLLRVEVRAARQRRPERGRLCAVDQLDGERVSQPVLLTVALRDDLFAVRRLRGTEGVNRRVMDDARPNTQSNILHEGNRVMTQSDIEELNAAEHRLTPGLETL